MGNQVAKHTEKMSPRKCPNSYRHPVSPITDNRSPVRRFAPRPRDLLLFQAELLQDLRVLFVPGKDRVTSLAILLD